MTSSDVVPVETDQWRNAGWNVILAALGPHPRRKGFWICASNEGPGYYTEVYGRRYLESLPLVGRNYFGGREHPGVVAARQWTEIIKQMDAPKRRP